MLSRIKSPRRSINLTELSSLFKDTKTRILLCYLALMSGFISLSIPLVYHLVLREVESRVTEDLWEDSQAFTTFLEQEQVNHDLLTTARLKDLFKDFLYYRLPEDDTFLITIIGEKFSRSSPRALPKPISINSNLMQQWKTLKQPQKGLHISQDDEIGDILYLAQPIKAREQVIGVLVIAHTTAGEIEEATEAILLVTKVLLFVLGIAFIFAWLLSEKVLAPLRTLAITARQISESDLSQRLPNSGKGELGELAQTFNEMMDRLEKSFTAQKYLLNDVGHELRTPITIIQGHLELMGNDPQEQQETLDLVFDELQRMTRLVNDLLLLAKTESGDFLERAALDLQVFSQELFAKVTGMASRHWRLVAEVPGSFWGDRQRLTQAMINLVENAVSHTQLEDEITLGLTQQGNYLHLWVKDRGMGIPEPEQALIFQRFYQGEERQKSGEGSGLGLAIVEAIARAHSGRVKLESAVGEGSTFTIVLPLSSHN